MHRMLRSRVGLRSGVTIALTGMLIDAAPAVARAQVSDPANDFLPSYTGPRNPVANGDLDVRSVGFFFNGSTYRFTSTSSANIGSTPGGFFVWGVNRGAGTAGFPTIAPGVLFDMVIIVNPGGTSTVRDLTNSLATNLAAGAVSFLGNALTVDVPAALLPSRGFAPTAYTANLWPRGLQGGDNVISDFAPDNSNITVQVTPEPGTALLLLPAFAIGMVVHRRRRRRAA